MQMVVSSDRCGDAKGLGTGSWYFPEGLLLLAGQTCKVRFFAACTVIKLEDDACGLALIPTWQGAVRPTLQL